MSAEESKAQPPEASHEHDTVNHAKGQSFRPATTVQAQADSTSDSASLKRAREGSQVRSLLLRVQ